MWWKCCKCRTWARQRTVEWATELPSIINTRSKYVGCNFISCEPNCFPLPSCEFILKKWLLDCWSQRTVLLPFASKPITTNKTITKNEEWNENCKDLLNPHHPSPSQSLFHFTNNTFFIQMCVIPWIHSDNGVDFAHNFKIGFLAWGHRKKLQYVCISYRSMLCVFRYCATWMEVVGWKCG